MRLDLAALSFLVCGLIAHGDAGWETESIPSQSGAVWAEHFCVFKGQFHSVSDCLRRWTGSQWEPLADVPVGRINAVLGAEQGLYVGGECELAGSLTTAFLRLWDGTNWLPILPRTSEWIGSVQALAADRRGRLVVAGSFAPRPLTRSHVVRFWDGKDWTLPGDGLSFVDKTTVRALAVADRGDVFVSIAVQSKRNPNDLVLHWDGERWERIKGATNVTRLVPDRRGGLYAVGAFETNTPASGRWIGWWNRGAWQPLGADLRHPDPRFAIGIGGVTIWNDDLIVSGGFRRAGDVEANLIAGWNGTNWYALGGGLGGRGPLHSSSRTRAVYAEVGYASALLPKDNELVAFGSFTEAGDCAAPGVARWNGTNWSRFMDPSSTGVNGLIRGLAADDRYVYAVGNFNTAGAAVAHGLARWNGTAWEGFPQRPPEAPRSYHALAATGDALWVCGSPSTTTSNRLQHDLLRWSNGGWERFLGPCPGFGSALAASAGKVCISAPAALAELTTEGANSLPAPLGELRTLAVDERGEIYAGGSFNTRRTADVGVMRWNGAAWESVGEGLSPGRAQGGGVGALLATNGVLYAGGDFHSTRRLRPEESSRGLTHEQAGIVPLGGVAQWRDGRWSALGPVVSKPEVWLESVNALAWWNGRLFAGGQFDHIGGVAARNIALWNGEKWQTLGDGVEGIVHALAVHGGHLYVGGQLRRAGGRSVENFARWRLE